MICWSAPVLRWRSWSHSATPCSAPASSTCSRPCSRARARATGTASPGFISSRLGLPTVGHIVGYMLAAVFVGITAWLVRRVWRGQTDWIDGAGWATVAMLVAASSLLPWYVAWLLPLAALGATGGCSGRRSR